MLFERTKLEVRRGASQGATNPRVFLLNCESVGTRCPASRLALVPVVGTSPRVWTFFRHPGVHDQPTIWIPASAGMTFNWLLAIEPLACDSSAPAIYIGWPFF